MPKSHAVTYYPDGALTVLDNETNDWRSVGDERVGIGLNATNTRLYLINDSLLWDHGSIVGENASSDGNLVALSDAGTDWRTSELKLGVSGSDNSILVTNQSYFEVNGPITLGLNTSSTGNLLHVKDSGSSMRIANSIFYLGHDGSYNTIRVSDGAYLTNGPNTTATRLGEKAGSHHNAIELFDPGTFWWDFEPMIIGYNGDYNFLVISNGATMRAYEPASLGENAGSDYNQAVIDGAGSLWEFLTDRSLTIGNNGAGNSMTIANGGVVEAEAEIFVLDLVIGASAGADSNLVIVTGSGSTFSNNGSVIVGKLSSGNAMYVSSGGRVINQRGWIGESAGDNHVTVDGEGSEWINMSELEVGYIGGGCSLLILNGGYVVSTGLFWAAYIGHNAGSDGNTVTVDGVGSIWENQGWLGVGRSGANNTLAVNNGGKIEATRITLGVNPGATNNLLSLNGGVIDTPELIIQNKGRIQGVGEINGGTMLSGGSVLSPGFSTGVITNNGDVEFEGGSLYEVEINGAAPGSDHDILVVNGTVSISNAMVDVLLNYVPALNSEIIVIANDGSDAVIGEFAGLPEGTTVVTSGAIALSISYKGGTGNDVTLTAVPSGPIYRTGLLGNYQDASGWTPNFVPRAFDNANFTNAATITWTNDATAKSALFNMTAGAFSPVNQNIGAFTWTLTESYIVGQDPGTDARVFQGNGTLKVHNGSSDALLEIGNGDFYLEDGTVIADRFVVTNSNSRLYFTMGSLVTGEAVFDSDLSIGNSGSGPAIWNVQGTSTVNASIYVGSGGANAEVLITNGTALAVNGSLNSYIGDRASSTNNKVLISGAGSAWSHRAYLYSDSAGNTLEIRNGGALAVGKMLTFGRDSSSYASVSNLITVTGSGSALMISNSLTLGYDSPANRMDISGGASVSNESSTIGSQIQSSNNHVTVAGAGTRWVHSQSLTVGSLGPGNSLYISGGAFLASPGGATIGSFADSVGNEATVTGAGSVWSNGYTMYVGSFGGGNALTIDGGGRVISGETRIGGSAGSDWNEVVVDGAGSEWFSGGYLYAGNSGSFNTFTVTNGGKAVNRDGVVGRSASALYNVTTITGSGSEWVNSNSLAVGESGSFNTLRIAAGGRAANGFFSMGSFSVSSNNLVMIDGPQSALANNGDAYIGNGGRFNTIVVTNGGMMITSNFMYLGYTGTDNTLVIAEGGHVDMGGGSVGSSLAGSSNNTLRLEGGSLSVSNNITVKTNNTVSGRGSITGWLRIENGGKLEPGNSIGSIVLSQYPSLSGEVIMELSKNGGVLTNDRVVITGIIVYDGMLTVNHLGPEALVSGDSFTLFDATDYFGSFDSINLPPLPAGLSWTDNLLVDGSIEVMGEPQSEIADVMLSGSNVVFSITDGTVTGSWSLLTTTNLIVGLEDWITNKTGSFDGSGEVIITNTIDPAIPHQSFRLVEP